MLVPTVEGFFCGPRFSIQVFTQSPCNVKSQIPWAPPLRIPDSLVLRLGYKIPISNKLPDDTYAADLEPVLGEALD